MCHLEYLNSFIFQAPLEGSVMECEVVWTGEGTWRPASICYDWDKVTNRVFTCRFPQDTAVSYGQAAQATCSPAETLTCS